MTNYANEIKGYGNSPELAGRVRLILGLTMMIAGLYFGLFTEITGHGLGLLFFIVSPLVFLSDKKRTSDRPTTTLADATASALKKQNSKNKAEAENEKNNFSGNSAEFDRAAVRRQCLLEFAGQ